MILVALRVFTTGSRRGRHNAVPLRPCFSVARVAIIVVIIHTCLLRTGFYRKKNNPPRVWLYQMTL